MGEMINDGIECDTGLSGGDFDGDFMYEPEISYGSCDAIKEEDIVTFRAVLYGCD